MIGPFGPIGQRNNSNSNCNILQERERSNTPIDEQTKPGDEKI